MEKSGLRAINLRDSFQKLHRLGSRDRSGSNEGSYLTDIKVKIFDLLSGSIVQVLL